MFHKNISRLAFFLFGVLVFLSIGFAFAANIGVPTTHLTDQISAITANALKPAACSTLNLTAVVVCTGGNCNGTNASELVLGTSGAETIRGKGGADCIVGGGGDDQLQGNGSNGDVCIGGPGNDTFTTCEIQIQ